MAQKDIVQNLIRQLGQSQDGRFPDELGVHFADIDPRPTADLLRFTSELAKSVNYFCGSSSEPAGNWASFFPKDESELQQMLASKDEKLKPHQALFLAFLKLYERPQAVLNQFTGRHLDFYFQDVLRFTKKAAVPDKAHVILELKKGAAPVEITSANIFSAGKDSKKVELLYAPTGKTVVNRSKVAELRSLFRDDSGYGIVRYAPTANSSDGVGGAFAAGASKWSAFGSAALPEAEVGFALASPVLRMKEGTRVVTVKLKLSGVNTDTLNTTALADAFDVYLTGEKAWLEPTLVSLTLTDGVMQFKFSLAGTEPPVVDYDPAIHGYAYPATAPVLQVLLNAKAAGAGYKSFKNVTLASAQVLVDVQGVTSLDLESDSGTLNPKKAFQPFGAQPTARSRFMVGCPEALAKKLDDLKVAVKWQGVDAQLADRYKGYSQSVDNASFTASVSFADGSGQSPTSVEVALFDSEDATSEKEIPLTPQSASASSAASAGKRVFALSALGSNWALKSAKAMLKKSPILEAYQKALPEPRIGFITFSLGRDFLHADYLTESVKQALEFSKARRKVTLDVLKQPYTPTIQSIQLSYQAHSDEVRFVPLAEPSLDDFADDEVQYYHVAYFGQMREHPYQRSQFDFVTSKEVPLLPAYENEGELLIGLDNLAANDSVSILFQVAEGSADPDLSAATIEWSVLCDNYWKPLGTGGVSLDTTNHLLASGLIQFVIPPAATTENTILPAGKIWLRGAIKQDVTAACQLIDVVANAVEVQFADQGNDQAHLATALEPGKIAKLKTALAGVKSASQPFASFGGRLTEAGRFFHQRVAEQLRHKRRCISAWDYERIVLEAFPKVHTVKCIPHARPGNWFAPGAVMLVVVPDLRKRNALNPLEPKVDAGTIELIKEFACERAPMGIQLTVRNPSYQKVQVEMEVKFRAGFEFNHYSEQLKKQVIKFLSPWAFDAKRELTFGGTIYKSVLLDFVEEIKAVDYVKNFKMYSYVDGGPKRDVSEATPATPDAILVSETTQIINPAD